MTTPLWVPLATAVVSGASGIVGALGGTRYAQKATQAREEQQYERQRRDRRRELLQTLYLDMAQHTEVTLQWLYRVTDELTSWSQPHPGYVIDTLQLTPRVELYCDPDLHEAWGKYVWEIEVFEEADRLASPNHHWERDETAVQQLVEKAQTVKDILKKAAATEGL
ncbi:hypothetical protein [Micromonospora aurantiaca (nom. illeg.)]|uniref:hypothetical protein n=1 Tax=Micromonospora aurantiaca (nom. illeg.) TaxID=47850 RepID=UPI003EBA698E